MWKIPTEHKSTFILSLGLFDYLQDLCNRRNLLKTVYFRVHEVNEIDSYSSWYWILLDLVFSICGVFKKIMVRRSSQDHALVRDCLHIQ